MQLGSFLFINSSILMVRIDVSEARRGVVLDIEGVLYRVTDTSHTHTGR
ncbi:hypothetical protein KBB05_03250 [Patescibacteria group bacterium]|nr:hypothetical protein [Patescibacteria group bacterium]